MQMTSYIMVKSEESKAWLKCIFDSSGVSSYRVQTGLAAPASHLHIKRNFWSALEVVHGCSTVVPRLLLASSICARMTLLFGIPLSVGIVILPTDGELTGSSFLGLNIYRSILFLVLLTNLTVGLVGLR